LRSWQMLFVAEAAPVCLIGLVGFWFLHDNPAKATWLSQDERQWLDEQHNRNPATKPPSGIPSFREFTDARVLMLSAAYFLIMMMGISYSFFFPSYLRSRGIDFAAIGVGLVFVHSMGIVGHLAWGRWSDYMPHNRQFVCFTAALMAGASLWLLPLVSGLIPIMVLGSATQMSLSGAITSFWPISMGAVRASAAAGVFAGISMLGNLTGLIGPYLTGFLHDRTDSYVLSFAMLGACIAVAGVLVWTSRLLGSDSPAHDTLPHRAIGRVAR
jgi:MFS transporter, ACS family, tartrate transporter